MKTINHRNLELHISTPRNDFNKLVVAGYYSTYNKVVVAARRGEDKFFLAPRDRHTDLSQAVVLTGRLISIGPITAKSSNHPNFKPLYKSLDARLLDARDIYTTRLLIAGCIKTIIALTSLTARLINTPEYQQALAEGRVIVL